MKGMYGRSIYLTKNIPRFCFGLLFLMLMAQVPLTDQNPPRCAMKRWQHRLKILFSYVMHRPLLDVVLHGVEKTTFSKWTQTLKRGLRESPGVSRWFLEQLCSNNGGAMRTWMNDYTLGCGIKLARMSFKELILCAIEPLPNIMPVKLTCCMMLSNLAFLKTTWMSTTKCRSQNQNLIPQLILCYSGDNM